MMDKQDAFEDWKDSRYAVVRYDEEGNEAEVFFIIAKTWFQARQMIMIGLPESREGAWGTVVTKDDRVFFIHHEDDYEANK